MRKGFFWANLGLSESGMRCQENFDLVIPVWSVQIAIFSRKAFFFHRNELKLMDNRYLSPNRHIWGFSWQKFVMEFISHPPIIWPSSRLPLLIRKSNLHENKKKHDPINWPFLFKQSETFEERLFLGKSGVVWVRDAMPRKFWLGNTSLECSNCYF